MAEIIQAGEEMEIIPEVIEDNPNLENRPGKKKSNSKKPKKEKAEKKVANKKKKESQDTNIISQDSDDNQSKDISKNEAAPKKKAVKKAAKKQTQSQDDSDDNNNKNLKANIQKKGDKKDGQKFTDDQIETKIVNYFKKLSNRPFSSKNIVDNMKKILSEAKMKKFLEDYCSREDAQISQKKFGSAPLFWYKQDLIPQIDKEELQIMQDQYEEQRQLGSELNEQYLVQHKLEQKLSIQLTNEQLENEIEKCQNILKQQNEELEFLESDGYQPVDQNVMKQARILCKKIEAEFKQRKELVTMFLDTMQDAMEGKSMADVLKKCKIDINDPDVPFIKV